MLKCSAAISKNVQAVSLSSIVCSLKACAGRKDLCNGIKLHALARSTGFLEKSTYLGNMLVIMYVKCGAIAKARHSLNEMRVRNVFTWSALMSGYIKEGQAKEALECYNRMRREGVAPNAIVYNLCLKVCGAVRDIEFGERIRDEIVRQGLLEANVVLGNALLDMYAKCGDIDKAQQVLDGLPARNVVSWSSIIAGYIRLGQGKQALHCYEKMQREGLSPDAVTYACVLQACGILRDINRGKKIHEELIDHGLLGADIVLGNVLIDMYVKCGAMKNAREVLDSLSVLDAVSWNTLITGYVQEGQTKEALVCFHRMVSKGLSPDPITYACLLKAFGSIKEASWGEHIHNEVSSKGMLTKDVMLATGLIDMYAKCGEFLKAESVMNDLQTQNVATWNALISGYSQQGHGKQALNCYRKMQKEGISPDIITYVCVLKACGLTQDVEGGQKIHRAIMSKGLLGKDIIIGNALIDMYSKCRAITKAHQVLRELPERNVVSWNALIGGYAQCGQGEEATHCYEEMQREGLSPDAASYASMLKVCGITQDIKQGKQIHDEIISQGLLGSEDVILGTALVDMYAKCSALIKAKQVLDELPLRNIVSWNSLITGYAQQGDAQGVLMCFERMQIEGFTPDIVSWNALIGGYGEQGLVQEALECFYWMQREGIYPDGNTFMCMLNACSHSGLVNNGQTYFEDMREKYGILPAMEHHTCMVGLFSHAGHFDKAMTLIKEMPSLDYTPLWSTVLGACQKSGNLSLGRLAFVCILDSSNMCSLLHATLATASS